MASASNRKTPLSGKSVVLILVAAILAGTAVSVYVFQVSDHAFDHETICRENLKEIGRALFAYQEKYGAFPPAFVADETGRPANSWRIAILPFLAQEDAKKLALYYRTDKAWDAPENRSAQSSFMPLAYKCPSPNRSRTKYQHAHFLAVVGEGTAWPEGAPAAVPRSGRTVLLIEYARDDVVWTEPRDVRIADLEAANPKASLSSLGLGSPTGDPPYVLYSNGDVERLPKGATAAQLLELAAPQSAAQPPDRSPPRGPT